MKKLKRNISDKWIGGICGGLGEYFEIDPNICRLIFIFITIFGAILPGILIYLIMWAVISE